MSKRWWNKSLANRPETVTDDAGHPVGGAGQRGGVERCLGAR